MCRILNAAGVEYVVLAALRQFSGAHRSPLTTRDLDVIPDRESDNLDRLGRALSTMNARIRIDGDSIPTRIDGPFLANMPHMPNLVRPTARRTRWRCRIWSRCGTNCAATEPGFGRHRWRAPFGHTNPLPIFIDPDLLQYDEVWPQPEARRVPIAATDLVERPVVTTFYIANVA